MAALRPAAAATARSPPADILAGDFDPAQIAGHIVLVGTSAAGLVNDRQATPIAADVPGVEIHAQLIDQILQRSFLVRPDWAIGAEILFALLIGAGLILILPRIGALPSAALGAVAVAAALGDRRGSRSNTPSC